MTVTALLPHRFDAIVKDFCGPDMVALRVPRDNTWSEAQTMLHVVPLEEAEAFAHRILEAVARSRHSGVLPPGLSHSCIGADGTPRLRPGGFDECPDCIAAPPHEGAA